MRITRIVLRSALALSTIGITAASDSLVWRESGEGYELLRYKVEGTISLVGLQAAATSVKVEPADKKPAFMLVQQFGGSSDKCCLSPKGYDLGYVAWFPLYALCSQAQHELGEVISWRGSTIARHWVGGRDELEVGGNSDILSITTQDATLNIVYFAFPRGLPAYKISRVEVYATAQQFPNIIEAERLFDILLQYLPFRDVDLYIRTDTWFIYQSSFPILAPFTKRSTAPDRKLHAASGTMNCSSTRQGERCIMLRP